ncbi:hypothetical protein Gotur_036076 [Gossypium turneri]
MNSDRSSYSFGSDITDNRLFTTKRLTIVLDDSNYLLWKQQVLLTLKTHKLQHFVDVSFLPPPRFLTNSDGIVQANPDFDHFEQQDNALASWHLSSVSQHVLPHLIRMDSTIQIWKTLSNLYSSKTTFKLMYYRQALHSQKKCELSMKDFLMKIKMFYDQLESCGEVISEPEHVTAILNGFPLEYESILTVIFTSTVQYNVQGISTVLLDTEARQQKLMINVLVAANVVIHNSNADQSSHELTPIYQPSSVRFVSIQVTKAVPIINQLKLMCVVLEFLNAPSNGLPTTSSSPLVPSPTTSSSSPIDHDAQALVATPDVVDDNAWYPDLGATHHLTNNVASLTSSVPYVGPGKVFVGNGSALPIAQVRDLKSNDVLLRGSLQHS